MNSKQDKLAAARKKLKEFQGKQKDLNNLKLNIDESILKSKCGSNTFNKGGSSSFQFSLYTDGNKSINYNQNFCIDVDALGENCLKANFQENKCYKFKELKSLSGNKNLDDNKSMPSKSFSYFDKNVEKEIKCDIDSLKKKNFNQTSLFFSPTSTFDNILKIDNNKDNAFQNSKLNKEVCIMSPTQTVLPKSSFHCDSVEQIKEMVSLPANILKESLLKEFTTKFDENDTSNLMQLELKNHIQTINIVIQQRNEAQNNLIQTQSLLNEKSEEVELQKQSIINLTFEINEFHKKLSDLNNEYKSLKLKNEKNIEKYKEVQTKLLLLESQFDAKSEEILELNKKYEEKKKECEQVKNSLNESQSQLSLCLIQLQQLSTEENSALISKISDLQNDNISVGQQFENLKKQLEIIKEEKNQSEQKFHMYAQQCNSQLNCLNSQIKSLNLENEKIKKDNDSLLQKLSDVENEKNGQFLADKIEELYIQINVLTETNKKYHDDCQKKAQEIEILCDKIKQKEDKIKNLTDLLNEVDLEKQNLLVELEIPKANKRLLAAIESEKIAAAKAVSQNQKLKSQVVELEKAFVKLSEEKLMLTDQLAHEKHIIKELQVKLKTSNLYHPHQSNYHSGEDHSKSLCKSSGSVNEALVNDSNEIEELRIIIRQLQNDKIELKGRLNSLTNLKNSDDLHNGSKNSFIYELKKNGLESKNSKFLLHQMEEKVRKTMNEIAVLDEEKEKLEHLVTQLQGETETIGEYITLYQRQRMLLRQRAQEKDNQLMQLSKDKEELRSKLVTLDELVQLLIKERKAYNKQTDLIYSASNTFKLTEDGSYNTVNKIKALIREIRSTNLINSQSVGIEHCSCCSGQLITI